MSDLDLPSIESRVRDLERWQAHHDGSQPGLVERIAGNENDIEGLRRLLASRDDEYSERFDKLNRTIAWGAGALSALVFVTQVILPLIKTDTTPQVIQIVPETQQAAPAVPGK